jgi:hypothetical protein
LSDWDAINQAILVSLPPTSDERSEFISHNIYKSLMSGKMECWILVNKGETYLLATGYVIKEDITGDTTFVVYSLYGYKPIKSNIWFLLIDEIKKRAKALGCSKIIAYSSLDRVVQLVKTLGWNTEFSFLFLKL